MRNRLFLATFAVTLALVVVLRLNSEALAVLAGVQSLPAALPAPAPVTPSSPALPSGARRFFILGEDGEAVL